MNLKFTIAYDGSSFQGSQRQPEGNTIEDEFLRVFKRLNIDTKIILSGRTDKEVHASGQVFNCQIPNHFDDLKRLKEILNHHLVNSVMVRHITEVNDDFHSRFHGKKRSRS